MRRNSMPTSACFKAGASFTPSPAIATEAFLELCAEEGIDIGEYRGMQY